MKIETLRPRIVRVAYHQEKGDPHYGSCLWAYYDFDLDRYMLNVQSDCGNAAYRWTETPESESFLHLMARISEEYLMWKFFQPEQIDVEATMKNIREAMNLDEMDEDEREDAESYLDEIENQIDCCDSEAEAYRLICKWNDEHDLEIDDLFEITVKDFDGNQKKICQIFKEFIQPEIRKILRGEDGGKAVGHGNGQ